MKPEVEEIKEFMEDLALKMRQGVTPSQVVLEMQRDIKEIKEILMEVVENMKQANTRLSALETWKTSFGAFISGGKSVWIFLATTIGIGWVVFGEFVKKKLGL